jgi:hypothetical protein
MNRECTICGVKTDHIEMHHKIPQRLDGPNDLWNIEGLCRSCHVAIEKMYNDQFWEYIGYEHKIQSQKCHFSECGSTDTKNFKVESPEIGLLKSRNRSIKKKGKPIDLIDWGVLGEVDGKRHIFATSKTLILCDEHRVCMSDGCESRSTFAIQSSDEFRVLCNYHDNEFKNGLLRNLIRYAKQFEPAKEDRS